MSFNQSIKDRVSLEVELQKRVLKNLNLTNEDLVTLRKKVTNEADIINLEDRKKSKNEEIFDLTRFDEISEELIDVRNGYLEHLKLEILSYSKVYRDKLKDYMNEIEYKKLNIEGKVRDIKKKLAVLKNFDLGSKFSFVENFNNLYNISKDLLNEETLSVDTEAKILTLPIAETNEIKIKNIFISKDSNGIVGNKEGLNKFIYSLIDNNENTFFEMHRLDSGPLILMISIQLEGKNIVNEIEIKRSFSSGIQDLKIKDIWFNTNESSSISIRRLVNNKEQSFTFENETIKIMHLPIEAEQIGFKFEVSEYSLQEEGKLFTLNLNNISIRSNRFQEKGTIHSERIVTSENLYSGMFKTKAYPEGNISYKEIFNFSENNELSKDNFILENNKTRSFSLDGRSKEVIFKYILERNKEINSLRPYLKKRLYSNYKSILKRFNKGISPNNISFKEKFQKETLKIIQPDIYVRSESLEKKIKISIVTNEGVNKVLLPGKLRNYNIKESELKVYLNNNLGVKQDTVGEVDSSLKYYIEDNEFLYVFNEQNRTTKIELLVEPLEYNLAFKNEGYYVKIEDAFLHDKKEIQCTITKPLSEEIVIFLEKEEKIFFLKENIVAFEFKKLDENIWEVIDEADYYLDSKNGILRIHNEAILENEKKIKYKVKEKVLLEEKDFEIWSKDNNVKGLFINPKVVSFTEYEESIDSIDGNYLKLNNKNVVENTVKFEESFFEEELKKVKYINGFLEFQNVKLVEKDYIPRIESNGSITIPLVERPHITGGFLSEGIKVFNSEEIEVTGLTRVIDGKLVTISGLPNEVLENWYLSYYYKEDVNENIAKYSVDSKEGKIYFNKDITKSNFKIYYQSGSVLIEYGLYNNIEDYKYIEDIQILELKTENLSLVNNKLKIIWEEVDEEIPFENLKNFYSPLIYKLEMELN